MLVRVFVGIVGPANPDLDDFHAEALYRVIHRLLDVDHDLGALLGQDIEQGLVAEHPAQRRINDRAQLARNSGNLPGCLVEQQWISDPVAGVGIDVESLLVGEDHALGWRIEIKDPFFVVDDLFGETES